MRIIQLESIGSFTGGRNSKLIYEIGAIFVPNPVDYFHPEANAVLDKFKKERKLYEPIHECLQNHTNKLRLGKTWYSIKGLGRLFISTEIRDAYQDEVVKEQIRLLSIAERSEEEQSQIKRIEDKVHLYRGTQILTFTGSAKLDTLADKLYNEYNGLRWINTELII